MFMNWKVQYCSKYLLVQIFLKTDSQRDNNKQKSQSKFQQAFFFNRNGQADSKIHMERQKKCKNNLEKNLKI